MWALREKLTTGDGDWLRAADFKSDSKLGTVVVWGKKSERIVFGTLAMAKAIQKLFNTLSDGTNDHYLTIYRVKK